MLETWLEDRGCFRVEYTLPMRQVPCEFTAVWHNRQIQVTGPTKIAALMEATMQLGKQPGEEGR